MSKSRNSKRREYEDEMYDPKSKKEARRTWDRKKEKRLTTALKSKNLSILTTLEEDL